MLTPEQIVKIIKDRDDFANVIEIKDNAKGEPQVSIKVRDDDSGKAIKLAIDGYKAIHKLLK